MQAVGSGVQAKSEQHSKSTGCGLAEIEVGTYQKLDKRKEIRSVTLFMAATAAHPIRDVGPFPLVLALPQTEVERSLCFSKQTGPVAGLGTFAFLHSRASTG